MANRMTDKLKETFDSTPTAVRWMLLGAAFIVVLILLFLLVSKKTEQPIPGMPVNRDVKLNINPSSADFSGTEIGTKKQQAFVISATYDAVIDSVSVKDSVPGFSAETSGCKNQPVNKDIACKVDVTFAPGNDNTNGNVTLVVDWHAKGDSRDINAQHTDIVISVGAVKAALKKTPDVKPIETVKSEPAPEPVSVPDEPDDFEEPEEPENIEIPEEDTEDEIVGARPVFTQPQPEPEPVKRKTPEKCSDFAMPGFSTSGAQIGWIKPKDGRYEFHPFSDTACNKPTGIYNPDTGIITSIDGKGRKIGTDADHIGLTVDTNKIPTLRSKAQKVATRTTPDDYTPSGMGNLKGTMKPRDSRENLNFIKKEYDKKALEGSAEDAESVYTSRPYDRTFILRQFKPIPATIVSEVRADPSVYGCDASGKCNGGSGIPVRATVDRNVYSDNGRTVIIPTGTLLLGYLNGELPGPYKSIGRMEIKWYQFIRPDGVEFNFADDAQDPYSADSQGRVGVPGYGSTDYIEQMVMPMLTAIIPAAVNMIAPIADTFVNQIDLDNNTVVQSGTVRSSEMAKNEVITAWNKVAQKLMVDALDNTVPPFSIAAGTRITVYSPVDLIATCGDGSDATNNAGKKCAFHEYSDKPRRKWADVKDKMEVKYNDPSWEGQVRSFNLDEFCTGDADKGTRTVDKNRMGDITSKGYDYRTVLAYCQSQNYQGKTQAKYEAYYQNVQEKGIQGVDENGNAIKLEKGDKAYNEQVLGLQYATDADGEKTDTILNPFGNTSAASSEPVGSLDCDGQAPDENGCCPGEELVDLGDQGLNCCPIADPNGDCFPPLEIE